MAESVYRVTEVIDVGDESWEAAARSAVETAADTVGGLRVAEEVRRDVVTRTGGVRFPVRQDLVQVQVGRLAAKHQAAYRIVMVFIACHLVVAPRSNAYQQRSCAVLRPAWSAAQLWPCPR